MAASSSTNSNNNNSNNLNRFVDDFYFSALFDYEKEIFPISDELYAEELHLQEALMSSALLLFPSKIKHEEPINIKQEPTEMLEEENSHNLKGKKIEIGESSQTHQSFCEICRDSKAVQEMFTKANCTHIYCNDCIANYVATKIQENVAKIRCPDMKCVAILEPHLCHQIIPKQVFSRLENVLSEALILGSQMVCCPFIDCGAVMVDDGVDVVTESECPSCHKLFCGRCNVPWHARMDCKEYQRLASGERVREDMMMMELAKKKKWRKCPNCKVYVEKLDGCLHVICRCGSEFCYGCGATWSTVHQCSIV